MARAVRVLVVDDNLDTQKVIADLLGDGDFEAVLASNGMEALRACRGDDRIALVLADIVMPGMSGFDLARRVKETRPALPVLLMTGYPAYADAIAQLGAMPLLKPFTSSVLLRVVGESVGRPVPIATPAMPATRAEPR